MDLSTLDLAEIAAYLEANPNKRDVLLGDMGLPSMATVRAGLRLADTISRPAWESVAKSSMTLSGHVQNYVAHRDA